MADDANVSQFMSVTGADHDTAAFYMSAARGDVESAVSAYFESDGMPVVMPTESAMPANTGPSVVDRGAVAAPVTTGGAGGLPSSHAPPPERPVRGAPPSRAAGGVTTLASLAAGRHDSDDDESGRNYYAGGEKSGQMIQDPRGRDRGGAGRSGGPRDGNPGRTGSDGDPDLAEAIFERARQRGPLSESERDEFGEQQSFTGAGYRLGDETTAGTQASRPDVIVRRNVTRTLTFYQNGFTVDDGPLRAMDDPANASFLRDIERGFVPREMEEPGIGNVSINLVDKKDEQYMPPKPKVIPFSGAGNRLGSASTAALGATSVAPNVSAASATVTVDESRPIASIQVRLSDGTRIVARLNEDHTVQNLRDFVAAARPGALSFALATAFPRKILSDNSQTIKDAQLNGAVVVQSLT